MQVHQTTLGGLKRLKTNYEEVFLLGRWNHVGREGHPSSDARCSCNTATIPRAALIFKYDTPCRHPHHLRQRR